MKAQISLQGYVRNAEVQQVKLRYIRMGKEKDTKYNRISSVLNRQLHTNKI